MAASDPGSQPWRDLCSDIALRLLDLTRRMSATLDTAMRDLADPDMLDALYALDSLVCQNRRYAENLYVLSGRPLLDVDRQATSLADLINAARGRIAGWQRINVGLVADIAVADYVSGDLIRVLTELLDNAIRYSPRSAPITASGHLLNDGGVLLRIEDAGMSIAAADIARHNTSLLSPDVAEAPTSAFGGSVQQGLQVVRHAVGTKGIRVWLTARPPQGTTALVSIPAELVCDLPTADDSAVPGDCRVPPRLTPNCGPSERGLPPSPSGVLNGPVAARQRSDEVSRPIRGGAAGPPKAARTTPGRLPTRVPQPLRDSHPVVPVTVCRANVEPGTGLDDAVDQIAAFNAATGGAGAPGNPEGHSRDHL